ncbi:hypothetical protein [Streptomyces sp. NPDC056323]|uniref:hypothetical protein n=1 Tax=Streptomyces sp. NPDC056323 TaxID=3345784 RepID=UPI0035D7A213
MALAQAVPVLPDGPDRWYEPKCDGHRTVLRRTDETVVLYARSGRVVTQHWTDLALAGMTLHPDGAPADNRLDALMQLRCEAGFEQAILGCSRPAERRELPPPGLDAPDSTQVVRFFNNYWIAPANLPWSQQKWSRG